MPLGRVHGASSPMITVTNFGDHGRTAFGLNSPGKQTLEQWYRALLYALYPK